VTARLVGNDSGMATSLLTAFRISRINSPKEDFLARWQARRPADDLHQPSLHNVHILHNMHEVKNEISR
jgi:hypothetical protein